jgi:hypothetical protein
MSPVYGPEDLIYTSVPKKRKIRCLERPAKRPAVGTGSKPDCSDADDEDDIVAGAGGEGVAPLATEGVLEGTGTALAATQESPSVADALGDRPVSDSAPTGALIVPSSQESSQSGSDSHNPTAEPERNAKAALHKLESATGVYVPQKYRNAMVDHSLALGTRPALENLRQAFRSVRDEHATRASRTLALDGPGSVVLYGPRRHPALDQFSHAYHAVQQTIIRQAVAGVLYRLDLAHLYDVYLTTLEALSAPTAQPRDTQNCRPRDLFDLRARAEAGNKMFWACYPELEGKPRSSNKGLGRKFDTILGYAARWHAVRTAFGIGMLPLVPRGANSWLETLPFDYVDIYIQLIPAVNPLAVTMAGLTHDWAFSLWSRGAPPQPRLLLEHLDTVDEISFKTNPLKLLKEVDIGYVRDGHEVGRAMTVPAGVDENNAAALEAAFSQGQDSHVVSSLYSEVSFYGAA